MRALPDIENDIEEWIRQSSEQFAVAHTHSHRWVLKYFSPRFLAQFRVDPRMRISATPGFTWGDGVYVVPVDYPYSSMIYGRIGVMGWIAESDAQRVFDGCQAAGVALYQEWIQSRAFLYKLLTTTVHADLANRYLRNQFRRYFRIDVVEFPPDQFNAAYTRIHHDRWLCVSDWTGLSAAAAGQRPMPTDKVLECEWVAIVEEEFESTLSGVGYRDLIGPHFTSGVIRLAALRANITAALIDCWIQNRAARSAGKALPATILQVSV